MGRPFPSRSAVEQGHAGDRSDKDDEAHVVDFVVPRAKMLAT